MEGSDDVFYVYEWCKKDSERKEMLILTKFQVLECVVFFRIGAFCDSQALVS